MLTDDEKRAYWTEYFRKEDAEREAMVARRKAQKAAKEARRAEKASARSMRTATRSAAPPTKKALAEKAARERAQERARVRAQWAEYRANTPALREYNTSQEERVARRAAVRRRQAQERKEASARVEVREARTPVRDRTHGKGAQAWLLYTLDMQGGRCAVCGTEQPGAHGWALDHDHSLAGADSWRGVLCMRCNCGIGFLQDSPQVVRQAVRYLTDWDRLRRNPHALLAASKVIDRLLQQEEDRLLPESDAEPVLISPL